MSENYEINKEKLCGRLKSRVGWSQAEINQLMSTFSALGYVKGRVLLIPKSMNLHKYLQEFKQGVRK